MHLMLRGNQQPVLSPRNARARYQFGICDPETTSDGDCSTDSETTLDADESRIRDRAVTTDIFVSKYEEHFADVAMEEGDTAAENTRHLFIVRVVAPLFSLAVWAVLNPLVFRDEAQVVNIVETAYSLTAGSGLIVRLVKRPDWLPADVEPQLWLRTQYYVSTIGLLFTALFFVAAGLNCLSKHCSMYRKATRQTQSNMFSALMPWMITHHLVESSILFFALRRNLYLFTHGLYWEVWMEIALWYFARTLTQILLIGVGPLEQIVQSLVPPFSSTLEICRALLASCLYFNGYLHHDLGPQFVVLSLLSFSSLIVCQILIVTQHWQQCLSMYYCIRMRPDEDTIEEIGRKIEEDSFGSQTWVFLKIVQMAEVASRDHRVVTSLVRDLPQAVLAVICLFWTSKFQTSFRKAFVWFTVIASTGKAMTMPISRIVVLRMRGKWGGSYHAELRVLDNMIALGELCNLRCHALRLRRLKRQENLGHYADMLDNSQALKQECEEAYGERDRRTLDSMLYQVRALRLAATEKRRMSQEESVEISKHCWELHTDELGERHRHSLRAMVEYATVLDADRSCTDEAFRLRQECNTWCEAVLDDDDPVRLHAMRVYAISLGKVGRTDDAAEVDKECWSKHKLALGATHPETLKAMRSHAISLGKQHCNEDSADVFLKCWRLQQAVNGKDHPDTLNVMRSYSITMEKLGHVNVAAELAFHAWCLSLAKLGESHVDTSRAMTELKKRIDVLVAKEEVTHAEALQKRISEQRVIESARSG